MNALTKTEGGALALPESQVLEVLQNSLYPGANPNSIRLVLDYCKAAQLDPMQKPVHIVPMWDKGIKGMRDVVMPGIGLYRTQAARSGSCAGVSEPEFGPDVYEAIGGQEITYPAWCRVTVKRRLPTGEVVEFTAKEFWKENYAVKGGQEKSIAPNAMWTKRPYGQIAKCSESQALRKAFPEIGSAPTAEEMEGKFIGDEEVVEKKPAERVERFAYTDAEFDEKFPAWEASIQAGKRGATAENLLARIKTLGLIKPEWEERLRAVKPQASNQVSKLAAAKTIDELNEAMGAILEPTVEESAAYDKRLIELEA